MDVDGLASQQAGGQGEDDPMDVNTGGDGDEQPEMQEELDVLMKEAEKLLGSPATHKDPKINNDTQSRPGSVSSLVNNMNLNTSPTIPGVPYPTSNVNPPARIQSVFFAWKKRCTRIRYRRRDWYRYRYRYRNGD
jgi:hypothetical protein